MRPITFLIAPVALALAAAVASPAFASNPPPPPSPPPTLVPPPSPPTPVPTVAATVLAPQPSVDVKLVSARLSRGQTQKLNVAASTDDLVVVTVHYKSGKPVTYKLKVGSTGKLTQSWKVPKGAPVGKASVKVVVNSDGIEVAKNFTFQVLK